MRFLSSLQTLWKGSSLKVLLKQYSGIWWVSLFKTGKPSSLGLDNCWKKVPKIGIDSRREKEIAFSTFGEAPIARLGYSLVLGLTDCLVGSSLDGGGSAELQEGFQPQTLGPTGPRHSGG